MGTLFVRYLSSRGLSFVSLMIHFGIGLTLLTLHHSLWELFELDAITDLAFRSTHSNQICRHVYDKFIASNLQINQYS